MWRMPVYPPESQVMSSKTAAKVASRFAHMSMWASAPQEFKNALYLVSCSAPTTANVARRFYAAAQGLRDEAKEDVKPVNRPKGVDQALVRDNGKQDTSHLGEEDTAIPARKDIRPQDVFIAKPKFVSVQTLVETGHGMENTIKNQIPKDKGYDAVKNLSQYLIETGGGGGAKAVGVK